MKFIHLARVYTNFDYIDPATIENLHCSGAFVDFIERRLLKYAAETKP